MKSTTFALTALASIAAATAESIFFTAKSDDNSINATISSIHEGAGINYFLVATGGSGEVFDLENGVASNQQGSYKANVGVLGSYLASGPAVSPETLSFNGDVLESNNFWACKNTNDPYSYSSRSYIIAANAKGNNTAPFAECTPVSIVKSGAASSSSASTSAVASSAASSATSSQHGWSNATVITTDVTVTGYTTYCPESTIITITTCSDHKCAPSVITATEATTITITGECVIPTTKTSAAPSSTWTSTHAPTTVITTDTTVTGYTTYCPASTVVTVTTCSNHKCAPTTITASSATTLTVTGECVVPTTITTAVSSTLVTKSSSTHSTAASQSSSRPASVSTGGAARAVAGGAGLLGLLAMCI